MKKIIFLIAAVFSVSGLYAQASAKKTAAEIKKEALKQEVVQDSINYIKDNLSNCETSADKRSSLYFLGNLQEQLGLYTDASKSYASAAGITATDAKDMPKVSTPQLVLNAVRASLNAGDWETATSYLNSSVRNSKNPVILAYINLYSAWSALCGASKYDETKDTVALLKAYSSMESMIYVKPSVLLTLWYVAGDESAGNLLKSEFPFSPEAGIVKGTVQIASVPFWYFVPRYNGDALTSVEGKSASGNSSDSSKVAAVSVVTNSSSVSVTSSVTSKTDSSNKTVASSNESAAKNIPYEKNKSSSAKQQLGLFKDEKNAKVLIDKIRAKGFDAYFYKETRSSGTTYCIVVVDENPEKNIGEKLKSEGFDCYPVK